MTVEERLEALEKEVQRLKDVQAIKELKSKAKHSDGVILATPRTGTSSRRP